MNTSLLKLKLNSEYLQMKQYASVGQSQNGSNSKKFITDSQRVSKGDSADLLGRFKFQGSLQSSYLGKTCLVQDIHGKYDALQVLFLESTKKMSEYVTMLRRLQLAEEKLQ